MGRGGIVTRNIWNFRVPGHDVILSEAKGLTHGARVTLRRRCDQSPTVGFLFRDCGIGMTTLDVERDS